VEPARSAAHDADAPPGVIETHISVLFLLGDRVYKLKKPVRFDFLDFSTRDARQEMCRREVALNRRLAPDVYLGVVDVTGEDGAALDHLVVMRRMPDERRLSTLVAARDPGVDTQLRRLARLLARFHASADRSADIARHATAPRIAAGWASNTEQLAPFADTVLDADALRAVGRRAATFVEGREALFGDRVAGGHVVDGHGDLQAADVFCLDDGPRVLDCIEFNDDFRHVDVADDVAFLAMDLERLGDPAAARRFLAWYGEFAGAAPPGPLVHLYIAYRAQVRCKVACLRWAQEDPGSDDAAAAAAEARLLLELCRGHLERATVRLVVVGGLPGTGKTTLASGLADRLGAVLVRSDEVRKELASLPPTARADAAFGEGIYGPAWTARVYDELVEEAGRYLARGESVVLDASWADVVHRARARDAAASHRAELHEVRCRVEPGVAAQRIEARRRRGGDASDATPAVASAMSALFADWPEALAVDTSPPSGQVLATVAAALGLPDA
jgi:hypothetical protein